jgi:LysR family hydrogen peroxide-inducible transcriptional activator
LVTGESAEPARSVPVVLPSEFDTQSAFQTVARSCLHQLIANVPALRGAHPEGFHQARVALRRSVDEMGDLARASRYNLAGRLRIGMIPTIAPYFLPTAISNIGRRHPELDIHVREALTSILIHELVEGRLDAALVALPVSEPSLAEVALFKEQFLLVRPSEEKGTPVPTGKKLRSMRLLLLEEGHCFRNQALSFCKMQSSLPREMLDASSLSTLVQMVSAGMGVTLIPEMAATKETRSASVSVARFKNPQPSRTIGMIWRKTSPLAGQLPELSKVVCGAADALRKRDLGNRPHVSGSQGPKALRRAIGSPRRTSLSAQ